LDKVDYVPETNKKEYLHSFLVDFYKKNNFNINEKYFSEFIYHYCLITNEIEDNVVFLLYFFNVFIYDDYLEKDNELENYCCFNDFIKNNEVMQKIHLSLKSYVKKEYCDLFDNSFDDFFLAVKQDLKNKTKKQDKQYFHYNEYKIRYYSSGVQTYLLLFLAIQKNSYVHLFKDPEFYEYLDYGVKFFFNVFHRPPVVCSSLRDLAVRMRTLVSYFWGDKVMTFWT